MSDDHHSGRGDEPSQSGHPASDELRIGAVSRLTGIAPDTIRAWERRYRLVSPTRSDSGLRLYSMEDVQRLLTVKKLKDLGEAVSTVARLSLDELRERLKQLDRIPQPSDDGSPRGPARLLILDPVVSTQIEERGSKLEQIEIVSAHESFASLESALAAQTAEPAVVVVRLPRLGSQPLETARRLAAFPGAKAIVVLYSFAPRRLLKQLELAGVETMSAPVQLEALARRVRELHAGAPITAPAPRATSAAPVQTPPLSDEVPERIFTDEQLGRLREIESALDCECPHHLSSIVLGLVAFERYSEQCENLDDEDALVHAELRRETSRARTIMEKALAFLCEREGIAL
jgi:DNA-binding transcriptional MerR regulator